MADYRTTVDLHARAHPAVRRIGVADLVDALRKGFGDFWAMPTHYAFLCIIYACVGLVLARAALGYREAIPLIFPLMAGFALVGPLAALGLYELSRRREAGLDSTWTHAFDVLRSPSIRAIALLSLVLLAIFFVWLRVAHALYHMEFPGPAPDSIGAFATQILDTQSGWTLIVVGNLVGLLFAVLTMTISVVSFPLLLDRPVGAGEAVATSIRAVLANPLVTALWGLIVAGALVLGSLPFFVGLAVVMPILGHATWHLYRKLVVR
jgi:uncharacterized membrane protein